MRAHPQQLPVTVLKHPVNLKNRVWKVAAGMGQEMLSCPSAALGRERFVCLLVQWDGLLAYIVLWWQL